MPGLFQSHRTTITKVSDFYTIDCVQMPGV